MDNTKTIEEIKTFVEKTWEEASDKNCSIGIPSDIRVETYTDKVEITVSSMYSAPGLNFDLLSKLSEFFKTRNINDDDRFSDRGCDTCDYGSRYGFTLTIRPD